MYCPFCNHKETKVTNKRDNSGETKRRRECLKCKKRFTTYERLEIADLRVIKKDGTRQTFDIEKIKKGILRACEKRPISLEQIDRVVYDIENKISSSNKKEIKAETIGELVMKALKKVDKVAYIRFASVYRDFKDIGDFKKELKEL
ncbi:transcriptional repressor NrdR [Candidatus Pacearchaeota archaeon]|nr:transcriptional repressor NrdR [Candidatus Pacearchaeota archaeon]